ncbi:MAG: BrnT family toxin [Synergistaceae bacterium]|nr:BrnT family toxin [Synergistaceae bacterium]
MRKVEHAEIKLVIDGIAFTWDDKKAAINLRKHGVRFSEAAAIFQDENVMIDINSVDDYTGEERLQAIGMVYGDVMFMVYVERVTMYNDDIIRIISARYATKEEERYYAYGLA